MKVFLSHSSVQKKFVRDVAHELGKDIAIVDEYDFECARSIWNEIRKSIDASDIFVFFISEDALRSDWIKEELNYVAVKVMNKQISFLPFIIDDTEQSNENIDVWVREKILTRHSSPVLVARSIEREISNLFLKNNQKQDMHGTCFEGRDIDMKNARNLLTRNSQKNIRAFIVSGLPYSGRKRFLREFININIRKSDLTYLPVYLKLEANDSIGDLVGLLNDTVRLYEAHELLDRIQTQEGMRETAIEMLNELFEKREKLVIEDNGAIVLSNGILVDWFEDLINSSSLEHIIHMYIASKNNLDKTRQIDNPIVSMSINLLDQTSMSDLLTSYCELIETEVKPSDRDEFIAFFKGYPDVLYWTIDTIKDENYGKALSLIRRGDHPHKAEIGKLVNDIKEDEMAMSLLILLSKLDLITFPTLIDIFGEKEDVVLDILDSFTRKCLIETFGKGNEYIRLAPAVRDYITRDKELKLKITKKQRLKSKLSQYVASLNAEEPDTPSDFSSMIMTIKELLKQTQIGNLEKKLLLPTFVLKVIIEEYNARNHETVIGLAKKVLYDYHQNDYESVLHPIRYWMCLSMGRLHNEEVLEESKNLNHYQEHFVRGFYYTHLKSPEYNKAVREYEIALRNKSPLDPKDGIKAKHQLVICLQKLGKYDEAVSRARDCFESQRNNPYYIRAYYECSLHSRTPNIDILCDLKKKMSELHESSAMTSYRIMESQYSYYIYKDYSSAKKCLVDSIKSETNPSMLESLFIAFYDMASKEADIGYYNSIKKKYGI